MTEEFRAEPAALVRAAGETLAAGDRLADALAAVRAAGEPPSSAYGDSGAAGRVADAAGAALADAEAAVSRLAAIHESDADRLLGAAFAYRAADLAAGVRHRGAGRPA